MDGRPVLERLILAAGVAIVMLAPILDVPMGIALSVLALAILLNLAHYWRGGGSGARPRP